MSAPDLALVDDRPVVGVEELDRVLDGHDVQRLGPVDDVDQRRQRGRLARTGRPGDEHQPTAQLGQVGTDVGQAERVERRDLVGDGSHHRADRAALLEDVDAEAADAGDRVGGVELLLGLEALPQALGEDAVDHLADLLVVARRRVPRSAGREPSMRDRRRLAGRRGGGQRRRARRVVDSSSIPRASSGFELESGSAHRGSPRSMSAESRRAGPRSISEEPVESTCPGGRRRLARGDCLSVGSPRSGRRGCADRCRARCALVPMLSVADRCLGREAGRRLASRTRSGSLRTDTARARHSHHARRQVGEDGSRPPRWPG